MDPMDGKVIRKLMVALAGFLFLFIGCSREPRQIPSIGLCLWLKADAGVTLNGSTVSRWADQSGKGNDAIQTETQRQPSLVRNALNRLPVLRFDGADDRLGLTGSNRISQISLFVMMKTDSGATGPNPYYPINFGDDGSTGGGFGFCMRNEYTDSSPDKIDVFNGQVSYVQATAADMAKFGEWKILSITTNKTMWATKVRVNGSNATITPLGVNMSISFPLGNPTGSGVGGIGEIDGGVPLGHLVFKGDIAEVIVYDIVLSDSLRSSVEQYLAAKYQMPAMAALNR